MKTYSKITILFFIVLLLIVCYEPVFKRAYYSTQSNCYPETIPLIEAKGYEIQGFVNATTINDTEIINVNIFNYEPSVIRHEMCHVAQFKQKRLFNCVIKHLNYLNEVECYLFEKLPIKIN